MQTVSSAYRTTADVAVLRGVDGDHPQAELAAGAGDPQGDLAPVGDENGAEHGLPPAIRRPVKGEERLAVLDRCAVGDVNGGHPPSCSDSTGIISFIASTMPTCCPRRTWSPSDDERRRSGLRRAVERADGGRADLDRRVGRARSAGAVAVPAAGAVRPVPVRLRQGQRDRCRPAVVRPLHLDDDVSGADPQQRAVGCRRRRGAAGRCDEPRPAPRPGGRRAPARSRASRGASLGSHGRDRGVGLDVGARGPACRTGGSGPAAWRPAGTGRGPAELAPARRGSRRAAATPLRRGRTRRRPPAPAPPRRPRPCSAATGRRCAGPGPRSGAAAESRHRIAAQPSGLMTV